MFLFLPHCSGDFSQVNDKGQLKTEGMANAKPCKCRQKGEKQNSMMDSVSTPGQPRQDAISGGDITVNYHVST